VGGGLNLPEPLQSSNRRIRSVASIVTSVLARLAAIALNILDALFWSLLSLLVMPFFAVSPRLNTNLSVYSQSRTRSPRSIRGERLWCTSVSPARSGSASQPGVLRLSDVNFPAWSWQVANLFTSKPGTRAVDVPPTKRNFFELTFVQKRLTTARRELRNYKRTKQELEQVRRINPPPRCTLEGGVLGGGDGDDLGEGVVPARRRRGWTISQYGFRGNSSRAHAGQQVTRERDELEALLDETQRNTEVLESEVEEYRMTIEAYAVIKAQLEKALQTRDRQLSSASLNLMEVGNQMMSMQQQLMEAERTTEALDSKPQAAQPARQHRKRRIEGDGDGI
jgi:hypothetical protein